MTIDLTPPFLNYTLLRGNSWAFEITLKNAQQQATDLTGTEVFAEILKEGTTLEQLTVGDGIELINSNHAIRLTKDWRTKDTATGKLTPNLDQLPTGDFLLQVTIQKNGLERAIIMFQIVVSDIAIDNANKVSSSSNSLSIVESESVTIINNSPSEYAIDASLSASAAKASEDAAEVAATTAVAKAAEAVSARDATLTAKDIAVAKANEVNVLGYQGAWNAATNTPNLTSTPNAALEDGAFYIVNIEGQQNITGSIVAFLQGDQVRKSGNKWNWIANDKSIINPFKIVKLQGYRGFLSIDTIQKKISTTERLFVVQNGSYYDVDTLQVATDWDSNAVNVLNYILFNTSTKKFAVVKFDRISNYNLNNHVFLGTVGTTVDSDNLQCTIEGAYLLNGVLQNLQNKADRATTLAGYGITDATPLSLFLPSKTAKLQGYRGFLSIDTIQKKISTTERLFVVQNGSYYDVDTLQVATDWDSNAVNVLNYILFNTSTKKFAVVKFDRISNYNLNNHVFLGTVGTTVDSNNLQCTIEGAYILDGVQQNGITVAQSTPTNVGISINDSSSLGSVDYQEFDTDYNHIIFYGQSLSMGWEAHVALTTTNVPDTQMIGDRVWITKGNNNAVSLSPLVATTYLDTVGESPAISATNSFKRLFDRFHRRGKQVKFITTNCGEGGRSVERLSKESTNGTNHYTTDFLLAINRAKSIVDGLGKTIGCSAIVYMQGEHNYNGTGLGLTAGTDATTDKNAYKALLLQLKNNMQADIMSTYGQSSKPLFFIYQTAGYYINREDMSINMGQVEFASENNDVILLNPTYQAPDYGGGHLTANGYRWYGELIAKSMYKTLLQGEGESTLLAKKASLVGNTQIKIDFAVPVAPLIFDTYTTPLQTGYGFKVRANGSEKTISGVEIVGNSVLLTLSAALPTGTIEVAYAGSGRNGSGNLRDSDMFVSRYTYYDDSALSQQPSYNPKDANNNLLYNKPYPMYNFASHFYFSLTL